MSYWDYIKKNTSIFMLIVLGAFAVIYIRGLWYPNVDSWQEAKYLALIIGIPAALFFVGNYVNWKKNFKR